MADNERAAAIIGRLSRVRAIESQLVDLLEHLRTAGAIEPGEREAFTRQSGLAARHVRALEEVAGRVGTGLHRSEPTGVPGGKAYALSVPLEDAIATAASAIVAYGALYAVARLLYETGRLRSCGRPCGRVEC